MRGALAVLVCLVSLAAPRLALACSVCSAGRDDESNRAFILSTIFLSVTPLLMFAGFGTWLYLRHRKRARDLAPTRAPVAPATTSLGELS